MTFTKKEIGDLGEEIAARFLLRKGYEVIGRNYSRKWGEIDIIAKNKGIIHFVEVKTTALDDVWVVSRKTSDTYQPEEKVHLKKLERLHRAIGTYLDEYRLENDWQVDVTAVELYIKDKKAVCRLVKNVL